MIGQSILAAAVILGAALVIGTIWQRYLSQPIGDAWDRAVDWICR